jgi:hypothetical protein
MLAPAIRRHRLRAWTDRPPRRDDEEQEDAYHQDSSTRWGGTWLSAGAAPLATTWLAVSVSASPYVTKVHLQ